MTKSLVYVLILGLIGVIKCELTLQIVKNTDDFISPVSTTVEEKVGTSFSLTCELVTTDNDSDLIDDNLEWTKEDISNSSSNRYRYIAVTNLPFPSVYKALDKYLGLRHICELFSPPVLLS
ncbi:hypothetical protein NQ317_005799 [Molorchus minor]|uniref:Ig-like domain-containing protein n=1 Tax=Molorchus minor TaxID=1323400 RepID=A0ABQ9JEL2_9CUCU|nr:hypothetical protein NQ317_005799 [Molorchus minor]